MEEAEFDISEEGFSDDEVKIGLSRDEVPDNTIFANYTEETLMLVTSLKGCKYQGMSMALALVYDVFKYLNSTRPEVLEMFGVAVEIKDRNNDS